MINELQGRHRIGEILVLTGCLVDPDSNRGGRRDAVSGIFEPRQPGTVGTGWTGMSDQRVKGKTSNWEILALYSQTDSPTLLTGTGANPEMFSSCLDELRTRGVAEPERSIV